MHFVNETYRHEYRGSDHIHVSAAVQEPSEPVSGPATGIRCRDN